MEKFLDKGIDILTGAGTKIIMAVLVLLIGRLVIRLILKFLGKAGFMEKLDPTVGKFLMSFIRIALYAVLVISIIFALVVRSCRMILGAHFLSDVSVGALLSAVAFLILMALQKPAQQEDSDLSSSDSAI